MSHHKEKFQMIWSNGLEWKFPKMHHTTIFSLFGTESANLVQQVVKRSTFSVMTGKILTIVPSKSNPEQQS